MLYISDTRYAGPLKCPRIIDYYKPANATYVSSLLDHAEGLFAFADKHRGSYSCRFPELSAYDNSTTYQDELLGAASWLYHATGNQSYLSYATGKNADEFADLGNPRYFSWDDKRAGTEVGIFAIFGWYFRCSF